MKYEWDKNKNKTNSLKHKLDFYDAKKVLEGIHLVKEDNRKDYKEKRFIAMGELHKRMVIVVYTERRNVNRIISMRKANAREEKAYRKRLESLR